MRKTIGGVEAVWDWAGTCSGCGDSGTRFWGPGSVGSREDERGSPVSGWLERGYGWNFEL